jgi:hypothetical protein
VTDTYASAGRLPGANVSVAAPAVIEPPEAASIRTGPKVIGGPRALAVPSGAEATASLVEAVKAALAGGAATDAEDGALAAPDETAAAAGVTAAPLTALGPFGAITAAESLPLAAGAGVSDGAGAGVPTASAATLTVAGAAGVATSIALVAADVAAVVVVVVVALDTLTDCGTLVVTAWLTVVVLGAAAICDGLCDTTVPAAGVEVPLLAGGGEIVCDGAAAAAGAGVDTVVAGWAGPGWAGAGCTGAG